MIETYDRELEGTGLIPARHYGSDFTSSGHLYLTRFPGRSREACNEIITKLAEHGVAANVHYKPLPLLSAYRKLGFDIADYPNAYDMYENEITLPLHTKLTDEELVYVTDTLKKCM